MELSIKDFVNLISQKDLAYGHAHGWLEDEDERFYDKPLDRRTAARIIHNFMRIELGIPDLSDISAANKLTDLYTCRVCVNHVAQVFLRGILKSQVIYRDEKEYEIFNHLDFLTEEEAHKIQEKIRQIYLTCHLKNSDLE